ncbi:MAG: hypothetical protein GY872_16705 [Roseibacillus sp.]|nr:hypothetical protein [Roseibacillus sp.]
MPQDIGVLELWPMRREEVKRVMNTRQGIVAWIDGGRGVLKIQVEQEQVSVYSIKRSLIALCDLSLPMGGGQSISKQSLAWITGLDVGEKGGEAIGERYCPSLEGLGVASWRNLRDLSRAGSHVGLGEVAA